MLGTFALMALIEMTIAYEKHHALIFATSILGGGLVLRAVAKTYQRRRETVPTIPEVTPEITAQKPTTSILVAVRGVTDTLRFALEEARHRQATLYVLFVREIAVPLLGPETPQGIDPVAQQVFTTAQTLSKGVKVVPLYAVSNAPAEVILDQAATLGVDYLILGGSVRSKLVKVLKGDVIDQVARQLPEEIKLVIYG